jgi:hypothetical protein
MGNGMIAKLALAAGVALSAGGSPAEADVLAPLLWKARPVVVVADAPDDPRFRRQVAALNAKPAVLVDYDIKVVALTGPTASLREKLGLPPSGFAIALVGKDGGVKESWREPIDPARILGLIDTMPMRRDEVRRKR